MTLDYTIIGSRIRRLRKQKLLTQEELAERADVSPVYIRYIEKAKRTAKLDTYVRIANALGCTMDDLLQGYQTCDDQCENPDELIVLLADCTQKELQQIMAMVTQLKQVLRS